MKILTLQKQDKIKTIVFQLFIKRLLYPLYFYCSLVITIEKSFYSLDSILSECQGISTGIGTVTFCKYILEPFGNDLEFWNDVEFWNDLKQHVFCQCHLFL